MKRWFAIALLLFVAATFAFAADDKLKHNSLTPKEIADGWILLFDGETTFGWHSSNGSNWTVADGMLAPQGDNLGWLVTTTAFADYELKLDFMCRLPEIGTKEGSNPGGSPQLWVNYKGDGVIKDVKCRYAFGATGSTWTNLNATIKNGVIQAVRGAGPGLRDQTLPADPNSLPAKEMGYIALVGNGVVFRNIKLKPLTTKPLFNGKDLTGWKEFPGKKSKFSVSKDGTLDIKNGPGDLATVEQYQDFILQAECLTNGPRLNSGIFFRCIPDQYQNGYEAQIHNGWTEKPEKEYTLEHYDPMTHTLKSKEKIKSRSMDYGTGAIYRRIPARRQVAKDNEWFTMTIAAEGNHLATWVNGVQVVDWNDNRPVNNNARNGCKLEKGTISLQGHDPTTDLSFRNIRIEELPSK